MGGKKRIYSVTQINNYIKAMFEQDFVLDSVTVSGEVSGCKYHSSGHIYFSLKDETGLLAGCMWASQTKNLKFRMQDGDRVEVTGRITVYEKQGKYQIIAASIAHAGQGDLYAAYLKLKEELEEAGYFDASYKKPIPRYASRIGVVTAATGAAVRDIISIAKRRNPHISIYLYPAIVQGEGAAESVMEGIRMLDGMGLDVIIIGRGGGSIEDLWGFNDERLAKAIFHAETPIVSAVGHETDFTIADLAADLRAPTPSAAAELTVFDYEAVRASVQELAETLARRMEAAIGERFARLEKLELRIAAGSPGSQIAMKKAETARLYAAMKSGMEKRQSEADMRLKLFGEKLAALSPLSRISKGYALVTHEDGRRVLEPEALEAGERLSLYMGRSKVDVKVEGVGRYGM